MQLDEVRCATARLSGFLYGLSTFSGMLREFESTAYCIETAGKQLEIETLIANFYKDQAILSFPEPTQFLSAREMEQRIRESLIVSSRIIEQSLLSEMSDYLTFRAMDMVSDVVGDSIEGQRIVEIHATEEISGSKAVFLCVSAGEFLLVIQFNHHNSDR